MPIPGDALTDFDWFYETKYCKTLYAVINRRKREVVV